MGSIFTSTLNTRPILPDSLRFIRSDVPAAITEDEINWLRYNGVTNIIDLRSDDERLKRPCRLANEVGFCYRCMPVSGGNAVPDSPEKVAESYMAMVDEQMNNIVKTIISAESGTLYFCNAGKDRTGVVSAILLREIGYDNDYIVADYMESAENLRELLEAFAKSGAADLNVITPRPEYIMGLLNFLKLNK